ncbi:MAG: 1-acyl-sn-glycerol-3-phosphate acyltransferase [Ruminococcus sp.]|nr:1-acyl-sn-glycerol-3-phosphate acyltransferase [Ruminococcus sp.]
MLYTIAMLIVRGVLHLWYDLKFEGRKNIEKGKPYIFVSNHRSYLDPVLVALSGYGRFGFMAKKELFEGNKAFSALIRWLGAFPVERGSGDMQVIETSAEYIRNGKNLLIFPEGTRSKTGRIGKGKSGVALVASRVHADIIPIGINFEGEKLHFRSKIRVRIGEPILASTLPDTEHLTERELLKTIRTEIMPPIMDGIRNLVDEPELPTEAKQ